MEDVEWLYHHSNCSYGRGQRLCDKLFNMPRNSSNSGALGNFFWFIDHKTRCNEEREGVEVSRFLGQKSYNLYYDRREWRLK